jgi:hypothetical protein
MDKAAAIGAYIWLGIHIFLKNALKRRRTA